MENTHPVDALALCRDRIKRLKEEEEQLKAAVKDLPANERVGRHYEAIVSTRHSRRIDNVQLHEDIAERLGADYLEQFVKEDTSVVVTLKAMEGNAWS